MTAKEMSTFATSQMTASRIKADKLGDVMDAMEDRRRRLHQPWDWIPTLSTCYVQNVYLDAHTSGTNVIDNVKADTGTECLYKLHVCSYLWAHNCCPSAANLLLARRE